MKLSEELETINCIHIHIYFMYIKNNDYLLPVKESKGNAKESERLLHFIPSIIVIHFIATNIAIVASMHVIARPLRACTTDCLKINVSDEHT